MGWTLALRDDFPPHHVLSALHDGNEPADLNKLLRQGQRQFSVPVAFRAKNTNLSQADGGSAPSAEKLLESFDWCVPFIDWWQQRSRLQSFEQAHRCRFGRRRFGRLSFVQAIKEIPHRRPLVRS